MTANNETSRSGATGDPIAERRPLFVWTNPGYVTSRDPVDKTRYYRIDTEGDEWIVHKGQGSTEGIGWHLVSFLPPDIRHALKAWVAARLRKRLGSTVAASFHMSLQCLRRLEPKPLRSAYDFTYEGFIALRTQVSTHAIVALRGFYLWCADEEIPGYSRDTAARLAALRIGRSPVHQAAKGRDPRQGPLDHQEWRDLREAVFASRAPLYERATVGVLIETGARPESAARLRIGDLERYDTPSGNAFYVVNLPRLKNGRVDRETRPKRISAALGQLLEDLIAGYDRLGRTVAPDSPLFRNEKKRNNSPLSGDAIHARLNYLSSKAGLTSARLADSVDGTSSLLLNPRRLRQTIATMLAELGAPASIIAEVLDHVRMETGRFYVANRLEQAEPLEDALEKTAYPAVMAALVGRPIQRSEAEGFAIPGVVPDLDPERNVDLGGIGACGARFVCSKTPPMHCYGCAHFQPFTDGPHEQMLIAVQRLRRRYSERSRIPSDLVPQQLDEHELNVEAVIDLVKRTCGETDDDE